MYRQLFTFTAESEIVVEMRQCILPCVYTLEKVCAVWKETVAEKGQQTQWKKTKQIFAYSCGLVF